MQALTHEEIEQVGGGVNQSDVISTSMAIIGIGAAAVLAGFIAPAWGPVALVGVSLAVTGSYLREMMESF